MNAGEFKVAFLRRAPIELADNEKVSIWEPSRGGTVQVGQSALHLDGKWRVSAIGNFLGGGILGELIIKPFFLKDRSETIPFEHIEGLAIHRRQRRRKTLTTFHVFQARGEGMVEVHVFTADEETADGIAAAIKGAVPSHLVREVVED